MNSNSCKYALGVLCWEAGSNPRGLEQLESLPGNSINPGSYSFPVLFRRVKGANIHTILEHPDKAVLGGMVQAAKEMILEGAKGITTSCGFNAIFQRELADALNVPVFTSSLLLVPFVQKTVGERGEVAIITAKKSALLPAHLEAAGITETSSLHVIGLEKCTEWNKIFTAPNEDIDIEKVREEVMAMGTETKTQHPEIQAFVLECTDLPPFAAELRRRTKLPVFDFITLVNLVHASL